MTMSVFASLQAVVGRWHVETFPDATPKQIRRKLLEEAAEVMCSEDSGRGEELADVLLVAMAIAHREGIDLLVEVSKKFSVVVGRDQRARELAR